MYGVAMIHMKNLHAGGQSNLGYLSLLHHKCDFYLILWCCSQEDRILYRVVIVFSIPTDRILYRVVIVFSMHTDRILYRVVIVFSMPTDRILYRVVIVFSIYPRTVSCIV